MSFRDPVFWNDDVPLNPTHDVMDYEAGDKIDPEAIDNPSLVSDQDDNCLVISLEDGRLYVACGGGGWPGVSADPLNCVVLRPSTDPYPGIFAPCGGSGDYPGISDQANNCLVLSDEDGKLYVQCGGGGWPGISEDADNIAILSPNDGGVYVPAGSAWPGISTDEGNIIIIGSDGKLYTPCCYPGLSVEPDNVTEYDDQGRIYTPPCTFEFGDFISETPDNCLEVSPDDGKLYVRCPEDNQYPGVSTDGDNCLVIGSDGRLYVACPEDNQYPGISTDPNNCTTLGTDGGIFTPCDPFDPNEWVSDMEGNGLTVVDNKYFVQTVAGPSWLPLYFDLLAGNTIKTMIPPDRTKLSITAIDSAGASVSVYMAASYQDLPEVRVPVAPEEPINVLLYQNTEVTFRFTGTVPGFNSFSAMVKLEN